MGRGGRRQNAADVLTKKLQATGCFDVLGAFHMVNDRPSQRTVLMRVAASEAVGPVNPTLA